MAFPCRHETSSQIALGRSVALTQKFTTVTCGFGSSWTPKPLPCRLFCEKRWSTGRVNPQADNTSTLQEVAVVERPSENGVLGVKQPSLRCETDPQWLGHRSGVSCARKSNPNRFDRSQTANPGPEMLLTRTPRVFRGTIGKKGPMVKIRRFAWRAAIHPFRPPQLPQRPWGSPRNVR